MRKILFLFFAVFTSIFLAGCNPLEFKQQAGLQVITNEIPASLFLDDQYLDKTPFINKKIKHGNYNLRIQPDDKSLVPYDIPVVLRMGMITVVDWNPSSSLETTGGVVFEMDKSKNGQTTLEFESIPNNAIITVDEGTKQFSPLTMDVSEGNHTFEVSLPSYQTQQRAVNVIKNHSIKLTIILGKELTPIVPPQEIIPNIPAETNPEATETGIATDSAKPNTSSLLGNSDAKVQILSTGFFVEGQEVLRVRNSPSSAGTEIGFAKVGQSYPYREQSGEWFAIDFDGQIGWIANQYSQKISP